MGALEGNRQGRQPRSGNPDQQAQTSGFSAQNSGQPSDHAAADRHDHQARSRRRRPTRSTTPTASNPTPIRVVTTTTTTAVTDTTHHEDDRHLRPPAAGQGRIMPRTFDPDHAERLAQPETTTRRSTRRARPRRHGYDDDRHDHDHDHLERRADQPDGDPRLRHHRARSGLRNDHRTGRRPERDAGRRLRRRRRRRHHADRCRGCPGRSSSSRPRRSLGRRQRPRPGLGPAPSGDFFAYTFEVANASGQKFLLFGGTPTTKANFPKVGIGAQTLTNLQNPGDLPFAPDRSAATRRSRRRPTSRRSTRCTRPTSTARSDSRPSVPDACR